MPTFLGEALKRLSASSSSKTGSYRWSYSLEENLLDELREVLNKYADFLCSLCTVPFAAQF